MIYLRHVTCLCLIMAGWEINRPGPGLTWMQSSYIYELYLGLDLNAGFLQVLNRIRFISWNWLLTKTDVILCFFSPYRCINPKALIARLG